MDATQKQEPRIEVLNALIRQIDLLTQSYTLEKQNTALTAKHQGAESVSGIREMEQQFIKRMTEVEMSPVDKIFADRDDLVRKGANKATINDAALSAPGRELAKQIVEENKLHTSMSISSGKIETNLWQEQVWKPLEQTNANNLKRFKEMLQTNREILDIGVASERTHLTAESGPRRPHGATHLLRPWP